MQEIKTLLDAVKYFANKLPEENKVRVEIELDAELHDKIFHGHKLDASELDAVFQAVRAPHFEKGLS